MKANQNLQPDRVFYNGNLITMADRSGTAVAVLNGLGLYALWDLIVKLSDLQDPTPSVPTCRKKPCYPGFTTHMDIAIRETIVGGKTVYRKT